MLTFETEWWGHQLLLLETLSFPGTYSAHGPLRPLWPLCPWPLLMSLPDFWVTVCPGPRPQPPLCNSNEHVSLQISPKLQIHILNRRLDISTWMSISHLKLDWTKKNHQALYVWVRTAPPITWYSGQNHPSRPIDSKSKIYPKFYHFSPSTPHNPSPSHHRVSSRQQLQSPDRSPCLHSWS